jgi:ectoine hydroxylase-related dioxygenase (phytanoyl-CoA dioxygenase family)
MDLGPEDYHPTLEMIGPIILSSELTRSESCQGIIDFIDFHASWQGLNGGRFAGKNLRKFVLDLEHNKLAHNAVEKVMKPYIQHVQSLYPCLVMVKYGAIKSFAGCPSQFEGHDNRFHTDYSSFYPKLPPHERPVSIILALDDFEFTYLPHSTLPRKDIVSIKVPPGHAIFFTNACLHSGGPNYSQTNKIRLFAYGEQSISSPYE